jgi:23S rRNA (adenine2030-N6)-methyltransferase
MNYRHAYHAGNFADVVKHLALVAILLHLRKKETPFAVIDSHAGRGLYDLSGEEARKTGEAASGIEKLRRLEADGALDGPLATYLEIAADPTRYPGSPLIAAHLLRPQDRLVGIEKHPEEFALLKQALMPWRKARAEEGDGYARLIALLPPPERRGVVLIDPPFEATDEFETAAQTVRQALHRFANGIYLIWFPVKSQSQADRFCGEVLAGGAAKALRIDIAVNVTEGKLAKAGLLILNPPFGLDQQMQASLDRIAPLLAGRASLEWLAEA